jgi:hypothetical protein
MFNAPIRSELAESPPTVQQTDQLRLELTNLHYHAHTVLGNNGDDLSKLREEDLTDLGWALREASRLADDIRKSVNSQLELVEKILTVRLTQKLLNDVGAELKCQGKVASASCEVVTEGVIPKPNTPEYMKLCAFCGIPEDIAKQGLFTFSWSTIQSKIDQAAMFGKPIPPGVGKTWTRPKVVFRSKVS